MKREDFKGALIEAEILIGVGAISSNATEGNALAMIYTMTGFIPLGFLGFLIPFPINPIWVVLTLFPTAPSGPFLPGLNNNPGAGPLR